MYTSKRKFRIWGFFPTHSTLLVRSNKNYDDNNIDVKNETTIDIEFYDVSYIDLIESFNGIILNQIATVPSDMNIQLNSDSKCFEIISENKKYFVVARGCIVGESRMDYDETRIANMENKYNAILFNK